MKNIKPILTKAAPLRMAGLLKEKVNEIVGQVNDLTEQVESQKPKGKSSKKKGSKMKKYLIILAALLTLTCQTAFGATYAAFLRDTGVDGVTIGVDSATKQIKVLNGNLLISGEIYYVDSVNGASDRSGKSWGLAMATIDQAINKAAAAITAGTDKGKPVIIVRESHNEAITTAGALDADVVGLWIVGLGTGATKPTLDYDASIGRAYVGANGITFENIRFRASINTVTSAVLVESATSDARFINCDFVTESPLDEFNVAIWAVSTTGLVVKDCYFNSLEAQAVSAIKLDYQCINPVIVGNKILGDYSTANINGAAVLSETLIITDNILWNGVNSGLNTEPCIEVLTGTTGVAARNYCATNLATAGLAIVGESLLSFENWYNESPGGGSTFGWQIGMGVRTTTVETMTAGTSQ